MKLGQMNRGGKRNFDAGPSACELQDQLQTETSGMDITSTTRESVPQWRDGCRTWENKRQCQRSSFFIRRSCRPPSKGIFNQ